MAWMADPRGRDQFLIQHPGEHAVCWNDAKKGAAAPFYTRPYWSDGPMSWSPQGTYAATLHPQGAALWVSREGATFERVVRFSCPGVQKADFSPGEELLTLYSVQERPNAPVDVIMTVFDVRSGRKLRSIVESLPKLLVGRMQINSQGIVEPFLSWSPEAPPMAARLAADTVQARYRRTICCSFACSAGAEWTCCIDHRLLAQARMPNCAFRMVLEHPASAQPLPSHCAILRSTGCQASPLFCRCTTART